jgi:hypothetical protein
MLVAIVPLYLYYMRSLTPAIRHWRLSEGGFDAYLWLISGNGTSVFLFDNASCSNTSERMNERTPLVWRRKLLYEKCTYTRLNIWDCAQLWVAIQWPWSHANQFSKWMNCLLDLMDWVGASIFKRLTLCQQKTMTSLLVSLSVDDTIPKECEIWCYCFVTKPCVE